MRRWVGRWGEEGLAGGERKSTEHWNKLRGGQGAIDARIHGRLRLDLFTDFIYSIACKYK